MKCGSIILALIALFTVQSALSQGQLVQYGKITYERRTNLYKKFDDERMREWLKEADKIKTDKFALYFNDSISMFSYIAPEEQDPMSWATVKNTVYSNRASDERVVYMDMWGTQLTISDSLVDRTWKITDKTRKIAGYECTRAIWQKNDSTRIHAWFTTDIIPTVGPECVRGLPGAVLGLATEDGGVVFFATNVEIVNPTPEQLTPPKKKGKDYTTETLKAEMTEKLKGEPYGERVIQELFFW
ncbi:MAG TPA: GLPGLI family protein [Fluviicola sp.]|nr:GLPGLI family protein [Fluviicola sp.]